MKKVKVKLNLLMIIFILILSNIAVATTTSLKDVEGHWAEDDIKAALELGILNGYPDGTFKPDNLITGAEFTKILINAMYIGINDDSNNIWYQPYVSKAKEAFDIDILGLDYNKPINRKEMAFLLSKAGEIKNKKVSENNIKFSDVNENENFIYQSVKMGLLEGYPEGTFRPEKKLTRAEAVVVLARLEKDTINKNIETKFEDEEIIKKEYKENCQVKIYDKNKDYIKFKYNCVGEPMRVSPTTMMYKNVYPDIGDIDILFLEENDMIKELIRINKIDFESISEFKVILEIDTNLDIIENENKFIFYKNTSEGIRKVFQTEPLFIENKQKDKNYKVLFDKLEDNIYEIKLPTDWIEKQEVENYPIIIDPSFTWLGAGFITVGDLTQFDYVYLPNGYKEKLDNINLSKKTAEFTGGLNARAIKAIENPWKFIRKGTDKISTNTKIVSFDGTAYIMSLDNSGIFKARDLYKDAFTVGKDYKNFFDTSKVLEVSYDSIKIDPFDAKKSRYGEALIGNGKIDGRAMVRLIKRINENDMTNGDTRHCYAIDPSGNFGTGGSDGDKPLKEDVLIDGILYFEKDTPNSNKKFRDMNLNKNDRLGLYETTSEDSKVGRKLQFLLEEYVMPENIGDIRLK